MNRVALRSRLSLGVKRLRPAIPVVVISSLLALVPFSTCGARIFFGIPCPACGLTRATLAAAHGDFAAALRLHPLSLVLLVVAAFTTAAAFVAGDTAWRKLVMLTTSATGVALIVVWALRFVGLFGGPVPG